MAERQEIQLQIQLDEDTAQGMYINMAMVNHNETEFIMDFIFVQPQQPKAKVRARVVTSPKHMKRLVGAMQDNLRRYEEKFGKVELLELPPGLPIQ